MRIGSGSMDTKNDADRYTTTLILPDVITKPKDRTLKKVLTLIDTGATLKLWKRRHSWWSKERWLPNQQRDNTPQRPDRSKGSKNGNRLRHHPDSYCPRQTPSLLLKPANRHHPRIAKAAHSWLRSVTKPESTTSTQSSQDRRSAFPVGYSDKHSQKTKLNSKGKTKLSTILKTHTESFSREKTEVGEYSGEEGNY